MNLDRAAATNQNTVLIGVDGGASGFRAHEIVIRETAGGARLSLGKHSAAEEVESVAGFVPQELDRQREQAAASKFEFTREERTLQGRWIHAASRAIRDVAVKSGHDTVRVGLCAPGVKTADGRGIELSLYGPRVPDFIDALEQSLVLDGVNLREPIMRVVSDGLACAHGEDLAEDGLFADIRNGYYLGGGSGLAESYKLAGTIHAADDLAPEIKKAWQLLADDGRSFETHLSAAGLNLDFGLDGARPREGALFPEQAAAAGEPRALALFGARAARLAELCCARLIAVHGAHGVILDRVVIGQRLGQFFLDPCLAQCFRGAARAGLSAQLDERAPPALRSAWVENGELAQGRLLGSNLRAAAALGALALELADD